MVISLGPFCAVPSALSLMTLTSWHFISAPSKSAGEADFGLPTSEPLVSSLAAALSLAFWKEPSMAFSGSSISPQTPCSISILASRGLVLRSPLTYWAPTSCGFFTPMASALVLSSPLIADSGFFLDGSCL